MILLIIRSIGSPGHVLQVNIFFSEVVDDPTFDGAAAVGVASEGVVCVPPVVGTVPEDAAVAVEEIPVGDGLGESREAR